MKNRIIVLTLIVITMSLTFFSDIAGILSNGAIAQSREKKTKLIEIGLTTDRSKTISDDGAFSAEILSKSGLATIIYNCQENVEKVVKQWAKKQHVRLVEKRSELEKLHLAYASNEPPGYFVLDYKVSSEPDEVKITFWFRTLSNVRLSGDQMGLEPLGEQLLQAIQCVPYQ